MLGLENKSPARKETERTYIESLPVSTIINPQYRNCFSRVYDVVGSLSSNPVSSYELVVGMHGNYANYSVSINAYRF